MKILYGKISLGKEPSVGVGCSPIAGRLIYLANRFETFHIAIARKCNSAIVRNLRSVLHISNQRPPPPKSRIHLSTKNKKFLSFAWCERLDECIFRFRKSSENARFICTAIFGGWNLTWQAANHKPQFRLISILSHHRFVFHLPFHKTFPCALCRHIYKWTHCVHSSRTILLSVFSIWS